MDGTTAEQDAKTPKAVKDRVCKYCNVAFTSSSLGRHLDVWIKETNPKPPDGIHDVEAIRKLRGRITRRRSKAPASRRNTSVSVGTPADSGVSEDAEHSASNSPLLQHKARKDSEAEIAKKYPFNTPWEATGVINNLDYPGQDDGDVADNQDEGLPSTTGSLQQRAISRRKMKQQLNAKQEVQDALDTAKAAELALREIIGSWRAAKHQVDINSMPFDFDPLSFDFPALTLHCLEPPPTLFASTQCPTPTSWSISPPGATQYEALQGHFREEFQKWKVTCAGATTAVIEDLTYPPSAATPKVDVRDEVRKAEKKAEKMEKQVSEHIQVTYNIWIGLPEEERKRVWNLEMARALGRSRKEMDKLKRTQDILRQENAHLKMQMDQLNRLQQPREFKISPPSLVYIDEKLLNHVLAEGVVEKRTGVGLNLADRHSDLSTILSAAIDRWKNVIVSSRSATSGLQAQRSLPTSSTAHSPATLTAKSPLQSTAGEGQSPAQSASDAGEKPATLPQQPLPLQPQHINTTPSTGVHQPAASTGSVGETIPSVATATKTPSKPASASGSAEVDADQEMADQVARADLHADEDEDADADADADNDADADAEGEMDVDTEGFIAKM